MVDVVNGHTDKVSPTCLLHRWHRCRIVPGMRTRAVLTTAALAIGGFATACQPTTASEPERRVPIVTTGCTFAGETGVTVAFRREFTGYVDVVRADGEHLSTETFDSRHWARLLSFPTSEVVPSRWVEVEVHDTTGREVGEVNLELAECSA